MVGFGQLDGDRREQERGLTSGRSQAEDVAGQHPRTPVAVEGAGNCAEHLSAVPVTAPVAYGLPRLWCLRHP